MKPTFKRALLSSAAFTVLATPAFAQPAPSAWTDVITVTGSPVNTATEQSLSPEAAPLQGSDLTHLAARTPGGARIANGELSGQMQYRGLFGERLNLRVDGQSFASGGPNLMDPVFHYAPSALVSAIVIDRGVSPVSAGPGLGGGADAIFKRIDFTEGEDITLGYDLTATGRTINDSFSTGGVVGVANEQWRINALGSWEQGEDTKFKGGTIGGTSYKRGVYGASAGFRMGPDEFSLDYRHQRTGESGTPQFPMDIIYVDTDFARVGYDTQIGQLSITTKLHYTHVDHLMDNFSQRPSPGAMKERATYADATTRGGSLAVGLPVWSGDLTVGFDGVAMNHDAEITNPNNAGFTVGAFPDISFKRFGGFAEWQGGFGEVNTELGVRLDHNSYDAGQATVGPALPAMPGMLAMAFNAADRSGSDVTVDAALRVWTEPEDGLSLRATLARKQKMPGYIQRYGWLPINASGGLADGNIYVGDLTLKPETAYIIEAGADYADGAFYIRPTIYLREVHNYIQGVPFDDTPGVIDSPVEMVANMNGDPTPLRWANVDARLIGFDMDGGYDFDGPVRLDAVLSYVRARRTDIDDNLYRIAPFSATVDLTWEEEIWAVTLETRAVADQNAVSSTNSEADTEGYVTLNLYGHVSLGDGIALAAGVENMLNAKAIDHLAGYNRNADSDVAVGARLPSAGVGGFLRLTVAR